MMRGPMDGELAPDATSGGAMRRRPAAIAAATLIAIVLALSAIGTANAAPRGKPNQIQYEYVPPKNPAHQPIHDQMKQGRALENLQELLSPLRLPYPLMLKVAGCDGVANAWYENEVITVCYELLAEIQKNAPKQDLPIGISRADTMLGPALDVFLHETGHAVFHMLEIPVLGREEDAADQFSAYLMLRLGKDDARRMILGSAYSYNLQMPQGPHVTVPLNAFSDEHSLPAQRAFNVLCIAYGADKKLFADVVEKDYLPKKRAEGCAYEYEDLTFAMTKLIGPHIDKRIAAKFHEVWTRTISARRARLARQSDTLDVKPDPVGTGGKP
ncbi:MAG: DUF4344 domain-containing metallopeptidase [Afipia sp.]|nr:DUF4344 domain-containing metallopeptidase [Afipia sp.]